MKGVKLETSLLSMSLFGVSLMILEGKSHAETYESSSDLLERSVKITRNNVSNQIPYNVVDKDVPRYMQLYFNWMARDNKQRPDPSERSFAA